jgi:hypothetical protein
MTPATGRDFNMINDYIRKNRKGYMLSPVICKDGFQMSVQVSKRHYCTPRIDGAEFYIRVEVGYPNRPEPLLYEFAVDDERPETGVYGYVPVEVVNAVIEKHGGLKK